MFAMIDSCRSPAGVKLECGHLPRLSDPIVLDGRVDEPGCESVSVVYNKYVKDGEFFVELVWWNEGLHGDTPRSGSGTAIVKLPAKNAK